MWEKEKLLVTSNFSFSHSVFKRLALQTRKNQGLFGKGFRMFGEYERNVVRYGWWVQTRVDYYGRNVHVFVVWTHSLIHHFENVPNSRELQTTTEMLLWKGFSDTDCI